MIDPCLLLGKHKQGAFAEKMMELFIYDIRFD